MSFFANILKALGVSAATVGTQGCQLLFIDEPEMPRQLIKQYSIKQFAFDSQTIFLFELFE